MKSNIRKIGIFSVDIILINLSIIIAYYLRFGLRMPLDYLKVYFQMAVFVTFIKLLVFYYMGLYRPIWKYAGIDEIINIFFMVCIANGMIIIGIYFLSLNVPRSIYVIATLIDLFFIGGTRFIKQIYNRLTFQENIFVKRKRKRVMIVGAGEAGGLLIQSFKNHPSSNRVPICLVDDDSHKLGRKINGVPVLGNRDMISFLAYGKKIDEIIIAIPSINKKDLAEIIHECKKTQCAIKVVPSINEIKEFTGNIQDVLLQKMRQVNIEDLLGREPVDLNIEEVSSYIENKVILVTGAGGSIGSELCRNIGRFNPSKVVMLDISEENLYNLENEWKIHYPHIPYETVIASIREEDRLREVFATYHPDIVFHAAAHKHVPLMEKNPGEAIKNNVLGTWNLVKVAHLFNVKRFILISTDKAVNPTNVMGATKRLCEMIIQGINEVSSTEFAAVRFGNVLGSSGSVIPLFKKQIEQGGPVTVTHPDIIRYFMLIPEAAQLVIQAGAMAKGGEIFVLDMGEPVKIDKLARDLIRLSGFKPDEDIKIEYTGLRPGEKLYEELLMAEEGLNNTKYQKIYIAKPMKITMEEIEEKIEILKEVLDKEDKEIIKALQTVVPTYHTSNDLF
ncbi:NAD-dependent epimerase/dehydratase family protein [Defluviitalea raffinosedens]|uniref:NAD-dependent epimerase/dehydratase family protein n=1 Tax=Defluviitalea raffinosedens TaxID=1450156 RepID=A0A7C8HEY3_9FIRM|nr:nucleoside-diphosphate sugar epimerase/dehydratase [Defluviitalea raffinosedens]KAE9634991.1 NAD-dependent epimerase/dehydratase family protein [Defluviitalea raffinosedens]